LVRLGLRVARQHQLPPVGQRQMHVEHQDVSADGQNQPGRVE
jgi:hypothetical protein